MTSTRQTLRLLFFIVETAVVASWLIFTGVDGEIISYRGHLIGPFKILEPIALLSLLALPMISFCIRRTDRTLAVIGFATFAGTWLVTAIFRTLS